MKSILLLRNTVAIDTDYVFGTAYVSGGNAFYHFRWVGGLTVG